jgi:hypothetical protein
MQKFAGVRVPYNAVYFQNVHEKETSNNKCYEQQYKLNAEDIGEEKQTHEEIPFQKSNAYTAMMFPAGTNFNCLHHFETLPT